MYEGGSYSTAVNSLSCTPVTSCTNTVSCANEGATCTCDGIAKFGVDIRWVSKTVTGSIACTVSAFGSDPASLLVKSCKCTAPYEGSPNACSCAARFRYSIFIWFMNIF